MRYLYPKRVDCANVPRTHIVDTPPASGRYARNAEQRNARNKKAAAYLAAVNGVVIPSKLAPSEPPNRGFSNTAGHSNINNSILASGHTSIKDDSGDAQKRKHLCPVCGTRFPKMHHVKAHFAPCVKRNGNPTGARWDDASRVESTTHSQIENSSVQQSR